MYREFFRHFKIHVIYGVWLTRRITCLNTELDGFSLYKASKPKGSFLVNLRFSHPFISQNQFHNGMNIFSTIQSIRTITENNPISPIMDIMTHASNPTSLPHIRYSGVPISIVTTVQIPSGLDIIHEMNRRIRNIMIINSINPIMSHTSVTVNNSEGVFITLYRTIEILIKL